MEESSRIRKEHVKLPECKDSRRSGGFFGVVDFRKCGLPQMQMYAFDFYKCLETQNFHGIYNPNPPCTKKCVCDMVIRCLLPRSHIFHSGAGDLIIVEPTWMSTWKCVERFPAKMYKYVNKKRWKQDARRYQYPLEREKLSTEPMISTIDNAIGTERICGVTLRPSRRELFPFGILERYEGGFFIDGPGRSGTSCTSKTSENLTKEVFGDVQETTKWDVLTPRRLRG